MEQARAVTSIDDKLIATEHVSELLAALRDAAESIELWERAPAPRKPVQGCIRSCRIARDLLVRLNLR